MRSYEIEKPHRRAASRFFQSQLSRFVHQVCRVGPCVASSTARSYRDGRSRANSLLSVHLRRSHGASVSVVRRLRLHRPVASPSRRTQGRKEMLLYVTRLINSFRRERRRTGSSRIRAARGADRDRRGDGCDRGRREGRDDLREHRRRAAGSRRRSRVAPVRVRQRLADPHNHSVSFRRTHDFAATADQA